MCNTIQEDEILIRKAQLKATGATIHSVAGLIGVYLLEIGRYNKGTGSKELVEECAQHLREFVSTGVIR